MDLFWEDVINFNKTELNSMCMVEDSHDIFKPKDWIFYLQGEISFYSNLISSKRMVYSTDYVIIISIFSIIIVFITSGIAIMDLNNYPTLIFGILVILIIAYFMVRRIGLMQEETSDFIDLIGKFMGRTEWLADQILEGKLKTSDEIKKKWLQIRTEFAPQLTKDEPNGMTKQ
jgi:hypothetical protein